MNYNHEENEREKLFNEVWKEPMTTVAKRYGLSDNGLRKRCVKLKIPLPPVGYWAKLEAGKEVVKKPKLPPLKSNRQIKLTEKGDNTLIKYIDVDSKTNEELEVLDGLDLLTEESKREFLSWCQAIQIPRKIEKYSSKIIEYQNEMEYRKARDKEHQFRDILHQPFIPRATKVKTPYRNNKAVLPLLISEKQLNRAFRIIEIIIRLVEELGGSVIVDSGEKDNARIIISEREFYFRMIERLVKRRALPVDELQQISSFRPTYEKIPSGLFEFEVKEILGFRDRSLVADPVVFVESNSTPTEELLGDIFVMLLRKANAHKITTIISDREYEVKKKEQLALLASEQEAEKKRIILEEQIKRNELLSESIDARMDSWNKSQKLLKFANELEAHTLGIEDDNEKAHIQSYIKIVRQEAENCDPVSDILSDIKELICQMPKD